MSKRDNVALGLLSCKNAIKAIRKRLEQKNPKVQLYTLELIEFCTCAGDEIFHEEINRKEFLQAINNIFSQKIISNDVKEKALYLIQFWARFFHNSGRYSNFIGYYRLVESKGVEFPPYNESPYIKHKKKIKKSGPFEESDPFEYYSNLKQQDQAQIGGGGGGAENSNFSHRANKLKKDLDVVVENIDLTNNIIDTCIEERRMDELLPEMILTLEALNQKMNALVEKLTDKNEEHLFNSVLLIIEDINTTKERYKSLMNKKRPGPFISAYKNNEQTNEAGDEEEEERPKPAQKPQKKKEDEEDEEGAAYNQFQFQDDSDDDAKDNRDPRGGFGMSFLTVGGGFNEQPKAKVSSKAQADFDGDFFSSNKGGSKEFGGFEGFEAPQRQPKAAPEQPRAPTQVD